MYECAGLTGSAWATRVGAFLQRGISWCGSGIGWYRSGITSRKRGISLWECGIRLWKQGIGSRRRCICRVRQRPPSIGFRCRDAASFRWIDNQLVPRLSRARWTSRSQRGKHEDNTSCPPASGFEATRREVCLDATQFSQTSSRRFSSHGRRMLARLGGLLAAARSMPAFIPLSMVIYRTAKSFMSRGLPVLGSSRRRHSCFGGEEQGITALAPHFGASCDAWRPSWRSTISCGKRLNGLAGTGQKGHGERGAAGVHPAQAADEGLRSAKRVDDTTTQELGEQR